MEVLAKTRSDPRSCVGKVQYDDLCTTYSDHLRTAACVYGLSDLAGDYLVEKTAIRLLQAYEVDPLMTRSAERSLFVLAIAREWRRVGSLFEKKPLLDMLKVVCVANLRKLGPVTLSAKVRRMSGNGSKRFARYDPQSPGPHSGDELTQKKRNYAKKYFSADGILSVWEDLSDWSPTSKLAAVREKLGLTRNKEVGFRAWSISRTEKEMARDINCIGFYLHAKGYGHIIVGSDYQIGTLEHEYVHSQLKGMRYLSFQERLFRGMDEALAEKACSKPGSYHCQRNVIDEVLGRNFGLEDVLYRVSRGDSNARRMVMKEIIGMYGLRGLLYLAFLAPNCPFDDPFLRHNDPVGYSTYLIPCDVLRALENIRTICGPREDLTRTKAKVSV